MIVIGNDEDNIFIFDRWWWKRTIWM